jgi:hypothetical protein
MLIPWARQWAARALPTRWDCPYVSHHYLFASTFARNLAWIVPHVVYQALKQRPDPTSGREIMDDREVCLFPSPYAPKAWAIAEALVVLTDEGVPRHQTNQGHARINLETLQQMSGKDHPMPQSRYKKRLVKLGLLQAGWELPTFAFDLLVRTLRNLDGVTRIPRQMRTLHQRHILGCVIQPGPSRLTMCGRR